MRKRQMEARGAIGVRSFGTVLTGDYVSPRHWHAWDQLTFASAGAMRVQASPEAWLVPAGRAIWIPARTRHAERVHGPATLETLYFAAGLARTLPRRCVIVEMSPLLRALVTHVSRMGELDRRISSHARLIGVLTDQLTSLPDSSLHLPEPQDPRAKQVADLLRERPDTAASIGALSRASGTSARTIERLFLAETAMTVGAWRRQLRLLHGVRLLAAGEAVGGAARQAGYDSPSAFIAAFRKRFGTTPGKF